MFSLYQIIQMSSDLIRKFIKRQVIINNKCSETVTHIYEENNYINLLKCVLLTFIGCCFAAFRI